MAGIEQVGEAIGTGEDHKQESPRLRRGRHPGVGHGAIERTVSPEVVGRDPEKRAPRRHEVRPPTQPADDWCADRQTLWHELEDRRTAGDIRSEEHTSELQSPCNLVCRLLLEKKKNKIPADPAYAPSMR